MLQSWRCRHCCRRPAALNRCRGSRAAAPLPAPTPCRGHKLECSHVGSTLVWQTSLRVAHPADLLYKYAVVDARLNVVKWESGSHTLHLPADLVNDAIVTVTDVWEVRCCEAVLVRDLVDSGAGAELLLQGVLNKGGHEEQERELYCWLPDA